MASHELRFEMGDMREKGGELIGMVARDASSLNHWDAILRSGRQINGQDNHAVKLRLQLKNLRHFQK